MATNPDDIARSVAQQNAYGGIYSTQYADAQKASRANQIAREIGLPADVVESDFPNVAADHRVQQGQMLAATTPQAATWLSDPRNAAAVSNDYASLTPVAAAASKTSPDQGGGVLSSIGHFFGGLGSTLVSSGKTSLANLESTAGSVMRYTVDPIDRLLLGSNGSPTSHGHLGDVMQAQAARLKAGAQTPEEESYWNDWHYSDLWRNPANIAKKFLPSQAFQITRSVPFMAETLLGKGVPAAVDITQQTAQARAANNGRPDPNAWDYAISLPVGIFSAAVFRSARLADISAGTSKGFLSGLGETAARDATLGATQAEAQYAGEHVGTDTGFNYGDMLAQGIEGGVGNATMGVALHAGTGAVMLPIRAMRDVAVARDGADYVDTVMDAAAQAKSRTQSPQEFQSFIDAHVKDSPAENMYIPGEAISALFQTAEGDPSPRRIEQDPFWSKYAQQVDEATRMGGDVVVPLSDLASHLPGTGDWNQLRDQVRFNPGGMSLAEAKEYATQKAPEDIEKAVTELSARMDQEAGGLAATRKAYQLYRDMGMSHTEAATAGVLQGNWIRRVNEIENAKREAAGQPTLTPAEEWDSRNLSALKTTEASGDGTYSARATGQPVGGYYATDANGNILVPKGHVYGDMPKRFKTEAAAVKAAPKMVPLKAPADTLNQIARGNISIERDEKGNPKAAIIRAFESSNFSTAVHEMGHYWIEDLRARALREDATEQERSDWSAAKGWFGELGHPVDDKEMIPEHAHEFWARGVERYIMEGKTPSHELNGVFARMAQWMRKLYQSVTALNAPISPEIRDVMDRLLASDSEIKAARGDMKMNPLEGAEALMTEAERAAYHNIASESREQAYQSLLERVMETVRNRRTREYNAQKKELRDDVTSQVDQQPVYRALKTLRKGEDGEKVKLPKQWLIDNYGEDAPGKMPKGIDPLFADEGMDPEEVASHAGFDSADQMVHALMDHAARKAEMKAGGDNRSPRQAEIEEGLKARIEQDIPDPYHDLENEARASIATDKAGDLMSMEARALSRKTGQRPAPWDLAKKWAQGHLQDQTTRDALTGEALARYARSVAKAGKLTEEALMKGDFEQALIHKNQQILNAALLQEAKRVKEQVETASRKMKRIANARTMPSIDQDYLDQAHALLEQVRMTNETGVRVGRIKSFERWYTDQVADGREPIVPIEYSRLLGTVHWTSLKVGDLLELNDVISQIVNIGRLKQRLIDGKNARDFGEGVSEMADRGGQQPPRSGGKTTDPRRTMGGRARSWLRGVDAAMVKVERMAIWLDGHEDNGPWQRLIYRPFADAQGRESDLLRQYTKDVNGLVKELPKEIASGMTRIVDTPELVIRNPNHLENGEPFRGTKDQVVMMALNWGNLGNRQRLLDGFGWDEGSVTNVFDRILRKGDWDFVQGMWDTVEKLWPDIAQLERKVNGVEPEKVEAAEIQTPHGIYRGGYFPAVYDPMQVSAARQGAENKAAPSGGWWSISTRSSATKERADRVMGRPLLLSMDVITRHLAEIIHDITHREAISQAKKLLANDRIAATVNTRLGPEYHKAMMGWLENLARPNAAYSRANPAVVSIARYLNKAVTTVGLGFRVSTSLVQTLGIPFSAKDMGAGGVAKGLATVTAHPIQAYNEMYSRSAEMRARSHAIDATIMDMMEEHGNGKLKAIGPSGIAKYAFQGIAYMDVVSRTTVWTSGFNKALVDGMNEDDAVYYADRMVRESHGIGFTKDRAAIQYDHPFARMWWPFFSYMNALYNAQRDTVRRFSQADTAGGYAEAARRAWWVFVVPAVLHSALLGGGPNGSNDDGGATAEDWAKYLGKEVVLGNLGSIPIIGTAAKALGDGYSYRAVPYQEVGEDIGKGGGALVRAAKGEDALTGSAIKSALTAAGLLTAKPLGQIGATAGGLYDYEKGNADPHTAGDWYNLLTRGHIPRQPTTAERLTGG